MNSSISNLDMSIVTTRDGSRKHRIASSVDPDETAHLMSRLIWMNTVCKIICLGLQGRKG